MVLEKTQESLGLQVYYKVCLHRKQMQMFIDLMREITR